MSYILDALKKSDQERQQGTSPNLYSVHSSIPQGKDSRSFNHHLPFWLIVGGIFLLFTCSGILFFLYQQHPAEKNLIKTTETARLSTERQTPQKTILAQPSDQVAEEKEISLPLPLVLVEDETIVPRSITADDITSDPPTVIETEDSQKSLPLLKDLPSKLQAEIPILKFAGHTYSTNPSQRMIIINGKILREGDMIAPSTHLTEITWEGVTIEYNGTRFRVTTN
jgi:general secretion pathway protein B